MRASSDRPPLTGRAGVVTGAGSGIGRAVALALARQGTDVACADLDRAAAEKVAGEVCDLGQRAFAVEVDVVDFAAVAAAMRRAEERLGPLDVLVNNAGFAQYLPFGEITEERWDRMIAVHLRGTFNCTQAVLGGMMARRRGRIINVSSVAGLTGTPTHVHYSAAKAGILGLTKALAKEVAPFGITVNAVAPGMIDTPLIAREMGTPLKRHILERIPVGRMGTADEIAYVVAFLAADQAGFVTGQVISPNGGYLT